MQKLKIMPPIELLKSNDFIDKIKYYRLLNGWNRFELSRKAGICQKIIITIYEKRSRIARLENSRKLLVALNIEDKS